VANQPVWWGMGVGDAVPVPQAFEDPEQLRRWLADEAGDDGVEVEILSGYPPAAACSWAEDHDADLIVAAAHRGFVDRVLLGSFAGFLAHHSPCPVLLVRPPHVATADEPSGAGAGPAT
jgi:nucleotide-binding universal stress UspA family protein